MKWSGWQEKREKVSEATVQRLHALVMGGGRTRAKPTPYRDGQNVIRDARSQVTVYMPPEAQDGLVLMQQFVAWINQNDDFPMPVKAGIAHNQFATIHAYYDGNGRTVRLLITLILHLGRYDLKALSLIKLGERTKLAVRPGPGMLSDRAVRFGPHYRSTLPRARS